MVIRISESMISGEFTKPDVVTSDLAVSSTVSSGGQGGEPTDASWSCCYVVVVVYLFIYLFQLNY